MRLQFIGCGDAFGSGGRFNTCFHLTGERTNMLIDCGASSLVGLKALGIDRNAIDIILVTHFHADHFGGIPFFVLDAQLGARRTRPLLLAGPPGLRERYAKVMDAGFPSFPLSPDRYPLTLQEVEIGRTTRLGDLEVTSQPVVHAEAAGPCLGYRIACEGKIVAYSGDTEWTETLIALGRDADLFICEASTWERKVKSHIDFKTLRENLPRIAPKRLVLTHMGEDMLAHRADCGCETASDGLTVEF